MQVRCKEGRLAGEIVEMPAHVARPLIARGGAVALVDEQEAAHRAETEQRQQPIKPKKRSSHAKD